MIKHHNLVGIGILVLVIAGSVYWERRRDTTPVSKPATIQKTTTVKPVPPVFNKSLYSINEADSLWVIVNKQRVLQDGFVPPDLIVPAVTLRLAATSEEMHIRKSVEPDMTALFKAAAAAGLPMMLASGYRSQSLQATVYGGYVKTDGQAAADRSSARPGHSEHQTGLAFDIEPASRKCEVQQCFGDMAEGQWIQANSYKYGFIVRYGKDQEQLTGYEYEPWHLRYVGVLLATELNSKHLTMEQFFGLKPALTY